MKKTIILNIFFVSLLINGMNLISYQNDKYRARIYYPETYKKLISENGAIFYNEENNVSFSLLYSKSHLSAKDHVLRFQQKFQCDNLLDSNNIIFSKEEKKKFNVDSGYKLFFTYMDDYVSINKTIIAMKKDSIVYLIIVEIPGIIDTNEINMISDCIGMFEVIKDDE